MTYDAAGGAWSVCFFGRNLGNTGVLANAQGGPAGLETADIGPPGTFGLRFSAHLRR